MRIRIPDGAMAAVVAQLESDREMYTLPRSPVDVEGHRQMRGVIDSFLGSIHEDGHVDLVGTGMGSAFAYFGEVVAGEQTAIERAVAAGEWATVKALADLMASIDESLVAA